MEVHSGHIYKLDNKVWYKGYFVLKNDRTLLYYDAKEDKRSNKEPRATIRLVQIQRIQRLRRNRPQRKTRSKHHSKESTHSSKRSRSKKKHKRSIVKRHSTNISKNTLKSKSNVFVTSLKSSQSHYSPGDSNSNINTNDNEDSKKNEKNDGNNNSNNNSDNNTTTESRGTSSKPESPRSFALNSLYTQSERQLVSPKQKKYTPRSYQTPDVSRVPSPKAMKASKSDSRMADDENKNANPNEIVNDMMKGQENTNTNGNRNRNESINGAQFIKQRSRSVSDHTDKRDHSQRKDIENKKKSIGKRKIHSKMSSDLHTQTKAKYDRMALPPLPPKPIKTESVDSVNTNNDSRASGASGASGATRLSPSTTSPKSAQSMQVEHTKWAVAHIYNEDAESPQAPPSPPSPATPKSYTTPTSPTKAFRSQTQDVTQLSKVKFSHDSPRSFNGNKDRRNQGYKHGHGHVSRKENGSALNPIKFDASMLQSQSVINFGTSHSNSNNSNNSNDSSSNNNNNGNNKNGKSVKYNSASVTSSIVSHDPSLPTSKTSSAHSSPEPIAEVEAEAEAEAEAVLSSDGMYEIGDLNDSVTSFGPGALSYAASMSMASNYEESGVDAALAQHGITDGGYVSFIAPISQVDDTSNANKAQLLMNALSMLQTPDGSKKTNRNETTNKTSVDKVASTKTNTNVNKNKKSTMDSYSMSIAMSKKRKPPKKGSVQITKRVSRPRPPPPSRNTVGGSSNSHSNSNSERERDPRPPAPPKLVQSHSAGNSSMIGTAGAQTNSPNQPSGSGTTDVTRLNNPLSEPVTRTGSGASGLDTDDGEMGMITSNDDEEDVDENKGGGIGKYSIASASMSRRNSSSQSSNSRSGGDGQDFIDLQAQAYDNVRKLSQLSQQHPNDNDSNSNNNNNRKGTRIFGFKTRKEKPFEKDKKTSEEKNRNKSSNSNNIENGSKRNDINSGSRRVHGYHTEPWRKLMNESKPFMFEMVQPRKSYIFGIETYHAMSEWMRWLKRYAICRPVFSGWLTKQGGSFKNWKRRYFILNDTLLMYYYENEKNLNAPLGHVDLAQMLYVAPNNSFSNNSGYKYAIELKTSDRFWLFVTDTEQDRKMWLSVFEHVARKKRKIIALKEGDLMKEAQFVNKWQQRYFVLCRNKFYYFKDKSNWRRMNEISFFSSAAVDHAFDKYSKGCMILNHETKIEWKLNYHGKNSVIEITLNNRVYYLTNLKEHQNKSINHSHGKLNDKDKDKDKEKKKHKKHRKDPLRLWYETLSKTTEILRRKQFSNYNQLSKDHEDITGTEKNDDLDMNAHNTIIKNKRLSRKSLKDKFQGLAPISNYNNKNYRSYKAKDKLINKDLGQSIDASRGMLPDIEMNNTKISHLTHESLKLDNAVVSDSVVSYNSSDYHEGNDSDNNHGVTYLTLKSDVSNVSVMSQYSTINDKRDADIIHPPQFENNPLILLNEENKSERMLGGVDSNNKFGQIIENVVGKPAFDPEFDQRDQWGHGRQYGYSIESTDARAVHAKEKLRDQRLIEKDKQRSGHRSKKNRTKRFESTAVVSPSAHGHMKSELEFEDMVCKTPQDRVYFRVKRILLQPIHSSTMQVSDNNNNNSSDNKTVPADGNPLYETMPQLQNRGNLKQTASQYRQLFYDSFDKWTSSKEILWIIREFLDAIGEYILTNYGDQLRQAFEKKTQSKSKSKSSSKAFSFPVQEIGFASVYNIQIKKLIESAVTETILPPKAQEILKICERRTRRKSDKIMKQTSKLNGKKQLYFGIAKDWQDIHNWSLAVSKLKSIKQSILPMQKIEVLKDVAKCIHDTCPQKETDSDHFVSIATFVYVQTTLNMGSPAITEGELLFMEGLMDTQNALSEAGYYFTVFRSVVNWVYEYDPATYVPHL